MPEDAVLSAAVRRHFDAGIARLLRSADSAAEAAITRIFGQAWRGGKFGWPYLQSGHGYELTQHGTYAFTTLDIPADSDVSAVVPQVYPQSYAAGSVPDVLATSQQTGWLAHARPRAGFVPTRLDLWVERTPLLTARTQTGAQTATIAAGQSRSGYPAAPGTPTPVTYGTPWQSGTTPALVVRVDDADYAAIVTAESATSFAFLLVYRPAAGTTGDNTDGPTTDEIEAGISTGLQSHDHAHAIPAGTDAGGGTTGTQSDPHNHGMSPPGSTHHHKKNTGSGLHQHAYAAAVSSNQTRTVHWVATGALTAAAESVTVSWQATGLQET